MPRLTQELQFPNETENPRAPYNGVAIFCKNGSLYTIDANGIVALIRSGSDEPVDLSNYYTINETDNAISTALSNYYTINETDNAISTAINALINGAPGTLDTLKELADAVNSNKSLVDALNEAISNKQDKLVSGTNIKTINGKSILGSGDIKISGGSGGTENAIPITGSSSLSGTFEPSVDKGANLGSKDKTFGYIYADNLGIEESAVYQAHIYQAYIDTIYVGQKIASTYKGTNLGTNESWFGGLYLGVSNSAYPGVLITSTSSVDWDKARTWELPADSGIIALKSDLNGKQDKLVSGTNIKTINGKSILGTGNITISSGANIDDSTISTSSTYSSSKIDSTYLKAPEGRLDIENGRVNLKNNLNSVYSITNNEVVMELNDDGLRYHDNATNLDVNITPYYGAIDQTVDPATIKVNGIGLARETDLNKKVSLRGDTMTGNLNAPAFTVDSTKVASGDKPLTDGAINFKYKNTNDEASNAWLTMLPSGQLQFGSQGAVASEIGTVATQEWVNKKITNTYIYKGSVDTYDALPSSADPGFVYNVRSNGANYAWTGTEWDELGATVNLDAYALKTDLPQNPIISGTSTTGTQTINTDLTISGTLEVDVSADDTTHLRLKDTMDGNSINVRVEEKSGINNKNYILSLPLKNGTLATLDDIPSGGGSSGGGSSGSGITIYDQMPAPEEVSDGQIIAMPTSPGGVEVVYNANASSYSNGTSMTSGNTRTYNSTLGAKNYWMITYTYSGSYTNTLIVPCTGTDFYGFHYSSTSTYLRCNASTNGKSITLYNTGETIYIHAVMAF